MMRKTLDTSQINLKSGDALEVYVDIKFSMNGVPYACGVCPCVNRERMNTWGLKDATFYEKQRRRENPTDARHPEFLEALSGLQDAVSCDAMLSNLNGSLYSLARLAFKSKALIFNLYGDRMTLVYLRASLSRTKIPPEAINTPLGSGDANYRSVLKRLADEERITGLPYNPERTAEAMAYLGMRLFRG